MSGIIREVMKKIGEVLPLKKLYFSRVRLETTEEAKGFQNILSVNKEVTR